MKKMIKKGIALLAGAAICLGGVAGFLPSVTASAGKSEQKVVTETCTRKSFLIKSGI